jgi:purine-binding chemotaxis protein CheW
VDILSVKEIRVWSQVTDIPNTPDYLKGVINLRGAIIPIIDLSQRFSRPAKDYNDTTVVIVLHTLIDNKEVQVGIPTARRGTKYSKVAKTVEDVALAY